MENRFHQMIQQITWIGVFLVAAFSVKTFYQAIPDEMYVVAGRQASYDFDVPVSVVLKEDSMEVFESSAKTGVEEEKPNYTVTCKFLGLFPVKDVQVMVVDEQEVYASGLPIGIYVKTDGVLVLGTSKVVDAAGKECYPSQNIVKSGDYIISVNGESVNEKEELTEKINAYGKDREILGIERDGEYIEVSLTPVESEQGRYLLGIWVRDDLAGVGTLTYHTQNQTFGALGHAVSDSDTGTQMSVSEGYIYDADIVGIKKGEKGVPGELTGVINYNKRNCLGTITQNSSLGIQGKLDSEVAEMNADRMYPVAYKQDIRPGTAYILSSVSGESRQYEIQIENLDYSGMEENKGILFRVTDPELLELTGGIVQGMSGSPIIQDGKIIGAVTHVFVSDASRGYGIFIEKMLEQ